MKNDSDRVLSLLERALSWVEADQAEIVWQSGEDYLTRFANNVIHQNVAERSGEARLRAVLGRKVGLASTRDLSEEGLRAAAREAAAIARLQPDNPDFKSLVSAVDVAAMAGATGSGTAGVIGSSTAGAAPAGDRSLPASAFAAPRTVAYTPEERADAVRVVTDRAKKHGLESAGAYSTSFTQLAVANSLGVRAFTDLSDATLTAVVMSGTGSGYADAHSRDTGRIDPAAVAQEAVEKCLANREPVGIDADEYEVILEEYAVAEFLEYLNYLGFSALAFQEGRSFMSGHLGQRVMDPKLTIYDDGLDAAGSPLPFDFEGVPKQRVTIIEGGVARGVVWDSFTAGREKPPSERGTSPADGAPRGGDAPRRSTGHAGLRAPFAANLFIAAGEASKQQMLEQTERGLLITRFHYIRPVHPTRTVVTGMTRDGTFLVEHGKIVGPVKNFRFTQSITEAFSDVRQIGRTRKTEGWMYGSVTVPALHLGRFNFTGRTDH